MYNELLDRGLNKERLDQMIKYCGGKISFVKEIVDDWGIKRCNKGYDIFNYDGTGLLDVEAIIDVGAFNGDAEAVDEAVKDGIKIIPLEDLPENFDLRWFGWLDTEENRKNIIEYCSDPKHYYVHGNSDKYPWTINKD